VFEFVILSGLRAAQLMRGCTPRIESTHKLIMTAQMEVAAGKVGRAENALSEAVDIKDALEVGTRAPSAA
jgi:DNA-directed RNA polymerase subunit K/omega